jgi:hypothetical protein
MALERGLASVRYHNLGCKDRGLNRDEPITRVVPSDNFTMC